MIMFGKPEKIWVGIALFLTVVAGVITMCASGV